MNIRPGNHQHIGTRKEQQDAFGFSDLTDAAFVRHGGVLALVADGMGGLQEGGEASRLAVPTFLESYSRKTAEETIEDALDRSLREANSAVYAFAVERDLVGNCGTTLVAVVVHESGVYWTYAGDSRLYMTDGQSLTPLTEDHIYANKLKKAIEKGLLEPEDALTHPEREALTSYIGDKTIEIVGRGLLKTSPDGLPADGFLLLLCSDGLYKTLSEEQILEAYTPDPEEWARKLVDTAIEENRRFQDNITVLCLAAGNPAPRPRKLRIRKRTLAVFAIAALLLLFAGGALWTIFSRTPPAEPPRVASPGDTHVVSGDDLGSPLLPEEHISSLDAAPQVPSGDMPAKSKGEQVRLRTLEKTSASCPSFTGKHQKEERG